MFKSAYEEWDATLCCDCIHHANCKILKSAAEIDPFPDEWDLDRSGLGIHPACTHFVHIPLNMWELAKRLFVRAPRRK